MTRLCEGRVAIVTGAGRGIGREHALSLARHGAKVVVNDVGGAVDGTGNDLSPAQQVVAEIEGMGGEAIANGDSVSDFAGAERLIRSAIDAYGDLHVLINNAGILRDRMLSNMTEEEWDAVINVHLKGTFATSRHAVALLAGAGQGRAAGERANHQHHVGVGDLRQSGPDQLRRRQGRHRGLHEHPRARGRALRRDRQRRRPDRADAHDREPRPGARDRRGARGALAGLDRADRDVAGVR